MGGRGAYRRSLARRASRPGRGARRPAAIVEDSAGVDRALDAARGRRRCCRWTRAVRASGSRRRRWELEPASAGSDTASASRDRARALDLPPLAGRRVRVLVRQLRGAAAPHARRLRHLRPEARPDRPARREPTAGRTRTSSSRRPRSACSTPRRVRAEAARVLEEWPFPTGWEDWRPDPSWPVPASCRDGLGPRLRRRGPLRRLLRARPLLGRLGGARAGRAGGGRRIEGRARPGAPLRRSRSRSPRCSLTGYVFDRRGTRILPLLLVGVRGRRRAAGLRRLGRGARRRALRDRRRERGDRRRDERRCRRARGAA